MLVRALSWFLLCVSTAARRPRNGRDPQDWRRRLAPPDGARDALCHPACAATPRLPSLRRCSPLTLLAADRDYLKSTQESFTTPPVEARSEAPRPTCQHLARSDQALSSLPQIIIQCLVATLAGIWGVLGLKGGMVPIRTTEALSKQTMDALLPGLDFMHFNTRELR